MIDTLSQVVYSVYALRLKAAHLFYTLCIDLVAPPSCMHCLVFLSSRDVFCNNCLKKINPIVSKSIAITLTKYMTVFAVADYKDPIKKLILAKRWSNHVASYQLGQLIVQCTPIKHMPYDFIVPVPLHWTRYAYRGFNQSDNMASVIAQQMHKPIASLLTRKTRTAYQAGLSHEKRQANVADVFAINTAYNDMYAGKHLLLVDDLMTTGSTLKAAARELLKLKPASITAVVACRVV